jgi:hypothetical protein
MKQFLISSLAVALFASAGAEPSPADAEQALQTRIALERQIAGALAPIKSLAEFNAHLNDGSKGMAAFAKLSSEAQEIFLSSLTFNERGLASYNYAVLEDALRVEEAYHLLSLLGVQHSVGVLTGLRAESKADQLIRQLYAQANSSSN